MSNERYLMMESDIKSLSFQLESITKSKYDSDWHSTLHTHPFTELFYVVDGKGEFNIQGQRFPVKANDFVIINPQVEHTELSSPDEPLEYIVLGINGLSFSNLTPVSEGGHPFSFFNLRDEQKDILRYLNAMVQEATSQQMSYEFRDFSCFASAWRTLYCHNIVRGERLFDDGGHVVLVRDGSGMPKVLRSKVKVECIFAGYSVRDGEQRSQVGVVIQWRHVGT